MRRDYPGSFKSTTQFVDADFDAYDGEVEALIGRCRAGFVIGADSPVASASADGARIPSGYLYITPPKTSRRRRA
jgi:hypothetical protein